MPDLHRYIIPLESGPLAIGGPRIEVSVTEDLEVVLEEYGQPMLRRMPSLVAVHLGAVVQSAGEFAGQEKARREQRSKR